jgi:hypothetical protein
MAQLGQTETVAAPNNLNFTDMISNGKPQPKHRELTARCLRLRERCFAPVEFLRGTPLLGCPSQLACRRCIPIVLFQCGQEGGANQSDRQATECENGNKDGHCFLSTLDEQPRQPATWEDCSSPVGADGWVPPLLKMALFADPAAIVAAHPLYRRWWSKNASKDRGTSP